MPNSMRGRSSVLSGPSPAKRRAASSSSTSIEAISHGSSRFESARSAFTSGRSSAAAMRPRSGT